MILARKRQYEATQMEVLDDTVKHITKHVEAELPVYERVNQKAVSKSSLGHSHVTGARSVDLAIGQHHN